MDKDRLEWYDYGWNYSAGNRLFPYGIQDDNKEAFELGQKHFNNKEFDVTDEEILKQLHDTIRKG